MSAHLKLGASGLHHSSPVINDKTIEGVTQVVLTQKLGDVARAVITVAAIDWEFQGDALIYLRPVGLDDLLCDAATEDAAHHKTWYVEQIAKLLHIDLPEHEPGITP